PWPFFFQAEDGIRARTVTGVQTCALPISTWRPSRHRRPTASPCAMLKLCGRAAPVATSQPPRLAHAEPVPGSSAIAPCLEKKKRATAPFGATSAQTYAIDRELPLGSATLPYFAMRSGLG